MKRGLYLLLILILFFPLVSSASIEVKNSYSSGETIIAKVLGSFVDPILQENVAFYRGHVKIPMDYEIGFLNNQYYIKASLIGKTANNYSIQINNVRYYNQGQIVSDPIIKNFTINSNFASFALNTGFVSTTQDFSISVESLSDFQISIAVDSPNEFSHLNSISIIAGQTKNIDFTLNEINGTFFGEITLGNSNTIYKIPVEVFSNNLTVCGNGKIDGSEECDGFDFGNSTCLKYGYPSGNLSCNPLGSQNQCTINSTTCTGGHFDTCTNTSNCSGGRLCIGGLCIEDFDDCSVDSDCDDNEKCVGNVCVIDADKCTRDSDCDSDSECVNNECLLKNRECVYNSDCNDDEICKNWECISKPKLECLNDDDCKNDQECKKNECVDIKECSSNLDCGSGKECILKTCVLKTTKNTCDDLNGTICGLNQMCEGNSTAIGKNTCCFSACVEEKSGVNFKLLGWGLLILVAIFIFMFYLKYKRAGKKLYSLPKLGGLSR